MSVERVRLALNPLEFEPDSAVTPCGLDSLLHFLDALRVAELVFEIAASINATARKIGVQLKRMPAHR